MTIFKKTEGQGEDVVLLHGWGCNHHYMQPIVNMLSKRYRVTNFDLPGRGQSDWRADNKTIHDVADQLIAELPKEAIYIGWSFGGLIATSLAARYPEKVKHFIGITTTPKFVTQGDWPGVPQPGFSADFQAIKVKGFFSFLKNYYDIEFATINPKPTGYYEILQLLAEDSNKVDVNILFKGIDICDATDLREQFRTLQCPVDLILGGKDDAVPLSSHQKIQQLNPRVKIHTIPDAGHLPFWTHQAEFNVILNNVI